MSLGPAEAIINVAHSAFVAMDAEGRITFWNPRAEELFGRSRAQALGSLVADTVIPERFRAAHREGLERYLTTGAGEVLDRRVQLSALRADGSEFPVEITISAVADADGLSFFAFIADISERRDAEQERERLLGELEVALRGTEQRLSVIVDALAEAVTIRGPDHQLIYANPAALERIGIATVDELRRANPRGLMEGYELSDEHGAPISLDDLPSVRLLAGEEPEPLLMRSITQATGREEWVLLKAAAVRDAAGQIEAAVTIIEDVTASKRAALQSEFLARASQELASSMDYEQTLTTVAGLAVPQIADWCAVDLFNEYGNREPVAVAHADPNKLELARRLREYGPERLDPQQGLGLVRASGESLLYPDVPDELLVEAAVDEEHLALLRAVGLRSALTVPMKVSGRTIGALTLVSAESGRTFRDDDRRFAEQLAARAAVAVENARLYTDRSRVAHTLQQSLLPDALPHVPGWDLAALYRPARAGSEVEVGGDFYDAFPTEHGWLFLIGDVTGKGVEAAAMTALVRHGARFIGESLPEPALILGRLHATLRQRGGLSICSALCLKVEGDEVTFSSAGHPLPLLITDDGVREVGETGPLLGAFGDCECPTNTFTLGAGEALLLYTDGVTDTVGEESRFGEQRLHQTMAECGPLASAELLACLDKALSAFQVGPQTDDTAAVALRMTRVPAQRSVAGQRAGVV
ncbi:MAG: SpoIIE family protein phosphatase [Solirubrobacteraceae bacterium]